MGSSQSSPSPSAPAVNNGNESNSAFSTNEKSTAEITTTSQSDNNNNNNTNNSNTTRIKKKPPQNESGYARAERLCRKKKRIYDACYTAALSNKEEDCEEIFDSYRSCFLKAMTKDMEKRGIKVNSGSMVGEFKDEIENDDDE